MKKELKVLFLFASLFLVMQSVFAATESSSGSDFTILGCDMSDLPGDYSDLGGNECSPDKFYFCEDQGGGNYVRHDTRTFANACIEFRDVNNDPLDGPICCPGGTYECTDDGVDPVEYFCHASLDDCSSWTNPTDCEDDPDKGGGGQCYWYEAGGECLPRRDQCYDLTYSECEDPVLSSDIGGLDVNCRYGEFESGGVTYQIAKDTCVCSWSGTEESGSCGLRYDIQKGVFGTGLPFTSCIYTLEETTGGKCNAEGFEIYTYKASNPQRNIGVTGTDFENLLEGDSLCFDREGRRACGEPVVRVPFFSFFNVLVVLAIIGIFYVLQSKRLSKKKSKTKSHTKKKR